MEQLSNIVDQVQSEDLDTNAKLLEWSERKFQMKVNEKILGKIALTQVELAKKIEKVKAVLENIFSLYSKLCDSSLFTQETSQRILSLERNLKVSSMQLPKDPTQSEKHFSTTIDRELAILTTNEANIKAKLIQIQLEITLHMEILHKEQAYAKNLLKKDPNLSTLEDLVHLVVEITVGHSFCMRSTTGIHCIIPLLKRKSF